MKTNLNRFSSPIPAILSCPISGGSPPPAGTCRELALAIKTDLEKEYYYRATVIIAVDLKTKSRGKIYVVGPVRLPGPQDIPSDEVLTLSKAILRAGGFGDFANQHAVRVTRKTGETRLARDQTFTVDVAEILEKGKTDTDLVLQTGDFIYVPERAIRF